MKSEISDLISPDWNRRPLVPFLMTLIRAGIEADKERSGGPISIVGVSKDGLAGVERGACKTD
jgi:hypothetical protein